MAEHEKLVEELVHLARIGLAGRPQDVQSYVHRISKKYRGAIPELSNALTGLLREAPTRSSPLRRQNEVALPVDVDTRFQLMRVEEQPQLDNEPVFADWVQRQLSAVVAERKNPDSLLEAGLEPTRTVLFTGPPGVGKTMAARWVANRLQRPLVVLDLAAVMSSYLGRTGTNLRHVLEYAKTLDCVLLLDELDAIAKRRDDRGEIGELKRLVTVLLQQLDDWPSTGLLLAATNHAELLDPAVWRRFEAIVEFPLPSEESAKAFILDQLSGTAANAQSWAGILAVVLKNVSFSEIDHRLKTARRAAALSDGRLDEHLAQLIDTTNLSKQESIDLAVELSGKGLLSQRKAHELTGAARDTIRARVEKAAEAQTPRRRAK